MKKTLLLMIIGFFSIFVMGQPVAEKTQINVSQKQKNYDNLQSSSGKGERLDSTITDSWDGSQWSLSTRKKYSYTVNGFLTTRIASKNDASTSFIWVNSEKDETTVNANGKTTLEIFYDWNTTTSQWVAAFKLEFTFDGSGNMTSNSSYNWNTTTSQWDGIARTDWTYTGGILTLTTGYDWSGGVWVTENKTEYTHDVNGNQIQDISYDWTGGVWVTKTKRDYTFANGKMTSVITSNWSGSAWVNSVKSEYTYDVNGNQILSISYIWSGSAWVNSSKTETTYASGKPTSIINSNWSVSVWVAFSKDEFTYGVSNGLNFEVSIGSLFIANQWFNTGRSTSWYSGGTTGINNTSGKNIRVYPNPAREFVAFDFTINSESATVEIFDVQGKKVLEQRLSENNQISVSNLPKGLYIYKLNNSGIIYTGKIMIE